MLRCLGLVSEKASYKVAHTDGHRQQLDCADTWQGEQIGAAEENVVARVVK